MTNTNSDVGTLDLVAPTGTELKQDILPKFYNIDTDDSSYTESIYSDDAEYSTDEELKTMTDEEKEDSKYLSIFENEYNEFDEGIMSLENTEELKRMESCIIDRTNKGYYRCKIKDAELYMEFMEAHAKYYTPVMLAMLLRCFSTHKNEAMNHSVGTSAPKTKTFSKTNSLKARVMLCAGAQIVGHHELWRRVFDKFNLPLDQNLSRHLETKDNTKSKRQILQKTKEYKSYRSTGRYNKFSQAHTDHINELKTGAEYKTGIAVKTAKKTIKAAPNRNPPGTLPAQWKCPFFHPE